MGNMTPEEDAYAGIRRALARFEEELALRGVATRSQLTGCSDEDIREVERRLNVPLPFAYREFLKRMGRGAGTFLKGSDWCFPVILELPDWTKEMLQEAPSNFLLPEAAIVILMHQGYQVFYILA